MKKVPLSEAKDDLSRILRQAEKEEVIITRRGKPAGILIGFKSEDDWFEYRLQEVKSGRARATGAGLATFAQAHKPTRKLLVGGDGIALEEFLGRPVEHWVKA